MGAFRQDLDPQAVARIIMGFFLSLPSSCASAPSRGKPLSRRSSAGSPVRLPASTPNGSGAMHMFTEKETAYLEQHRIEADPRVAFVVDDLAPGSSFGPRGITIRLVAIATTIT
jgi:hypothetical protein